MGVDPYMVGIVAILGGLGTVITFTTLVMRFKLKKKELEMRGHAESGPVIDALRDDIDDTRAQLAEVQERLDFAERLLAAGRAPQEGGSDERR